VRIRLIGAEEAGVAGPLPYGAVSSGVLIVELLRIVISRLPRGVP